MPAMESWATPTPSPDVKFEHSPAESFLSMPGEMYPSLFGSSSTTTMNPLEIITPQALATEDENVEGSAISESSTDSSPASGEKKPVKKRKSWGQVLPEPKTNLPPRKRAKTEDEKEQRRVERVLRNRRAAQSSRERKRLEVEALEERNKELEAMLRQVQQTNLALVEELHKAQRNSGVMARAAPSFDGMPNAVTFSQELFSSQDGHNTLLKQAGRSIEDLLMSTQTNNTVNPQSLSPALTPVPDEEDEDQDLDDEPATSATPAADVRATSEEAYTDATQHPAAMLCEDLQCRSVKAPRSWLTTSQQQLPPALALVLPIQLLLASTSAMLSIFQRPLMQIAMSLRVGSSLPPTPAILNTIIWLVTTPRPSLSRQPPLAANLKSSTSTTTSTTSSTCSHLAATSSSSTTSRTTTAQSQPARLSSTLRLKSLRKILSSSPTLARPLLDATMVALRLASSEEHCVDRVDGAGKFVATAAATEARGLPQQLLQPGEGWPSETQVPSKEVLLALLWTITVEDRRLQARNRSPSSLLPLKRLGRQGVAKVTSIHIKNQTKKPPKYVLKVVSSRNMALGATALS